MNFLQTRWIGRLAYTSALEMQEKTAAARAKDEVPDQLFLLEHDPVYTIGRQRDRSSLGGTPLAHPVAEISRGGQATFHGPGQLVGYFVFDLQKLTPDLHIFLRWMEEGLIALVAGYGLHAQRREGLTGVWIGDRKIASIGVGVRKWITMHGFGLNVGSDLSGFASITPCGISGVTMTSLSRELGREIPVEEVATKGEAIFTARYSLLSTANPQPSTPQP
jgi:lipoyl(octanoyl) transferase